MVHVCAKVGHIVVDKWHEHDVNSVLDDFCHICVPDNGMVRETADHVRAEWFGEK